MRAFNYSKIKEQKWDSEILGYIAAIYKEAGKQELYLKQRPEELERLVEIAKVQSTEASNAIEGIVTTSTRIKQLVEEKTTPRNRDEQEIAGYRDVLNLIHENFDVIPITQNYILQLHKVLYSHMNNPVAGRTKNVQNYISATYPDGHSEVLFTPLAPYETPAALDRICEEYNRVIGNFEVEPLIAIPVFIHDFLCIHPFNDGNGRMSRLLTTLMLYQNGFYVGKYISLEAKIAKDKDLYYSALAQAQTGWYEGTEDVVPFIKYILGTILSAYRDFEEAPGPERIGGSGCRRIGLYRGGGSPPKTAVRRCLPMPRSLLHQPERTRRKGFRPLSGTSRKRDTRLYLRAYPRRNELRGICVWRRRDARLPESRPERQRHRPLLFPMS